MPAQKGDGEPTKRDRNVGGGEGWGLSPGKTAVQPQACAGYTGTPPLRHPAHTHRCTRTYTCALMRPHSHTGTLVSTHTPSHTLTSTLVLTLTRMHAHTTLCWNRCALFHESPLLSRSQLLNSCCKLNYLNL